MQPSSLSPLPLACCQITIDVDALLSATGIDPKDPPGQRVSAAADNLRGICIHGAMIADGNGFGKTKQCLLTASLLFASTKENRPASLTLNHPEASQVQQENAEDETTDKHRTVNITEELHSSFYNATTASSSPLDPVLPDQPYSGEELQDNVASQEDLNQVRHLSKQLKW
jgi:hypothetical protein